MKLNIVMFGQVAYDEALALQETLLAKRQNHEIEDTLLLLEHPPVLTMGVRAEQKNIYLSQEQLTALGVQVYPIKRGGDVTYHGPGQIVGYPIMDLSQHGKSIKTFVERIKHAFVALLQEEYGITAHAEDGVFSGVWVGSEKITAIGIAVHRWVTMHGFAFNGNTDLSHFDWINPCGLTGRGVTSLQKLTGKAQNMEELKELVARYFCQTFQMEEHRCSLESLIG